VNENQNSWTKIYFQHNLKTRKRDDPQNFGMRSLSPKICAISLGLVTEAVFVSIIVVSGMLAVFDQGLGPCDSLPLFFIILLLLHYPGLILAELLHFPGPLAFWFSAIVSGFLWSVFWYLCLKVFGKKNEAAQKQN
jgi:hypothetical protein